MKKAILGLALVAVLAFAVAPAFGAPSPLAIAKKALKTAKSAKKTATAASKAAKRGVRTVSVSSGDVSAPPLDFAHFDVRCPAGYAPTGPSMGLGALEPVAVLDTPNGYIGSYYNPSDQTFFSGELDVVCAKGAWAGIASSHRSRASAQRQLQQDEREFLAAK